MYSAVIEVALSIVPTSSIKFVALLAGNGNTGRKGGSEVEVSRVQDGWQDRDSCKI